MSLQLFPIARWSIRNKTFIKVECRNCKKTFNVCTKIKLAKCECGNQEKMFLLKYLYTESKKLRKE